MVETPTKVLLAPDAPLTRLRGVGASTAAHLAAVGIVDLRALLSYFPTRLRDVSVCAAPSVDRVGQLVRFPCEVRSAALRFLPGRRSLLTVRVAAADGTPCDVVYFNQPYLKNAFAAGSQRVAEGTLRLSGKRLTLNPARLLDARDAGDGPLRLVYPEVEGVSATRLTRLLQQALAQVDFGHWPRPALPPGFAADVASYAEAVRAMHAPQDLAEHERARRHFAVLEALRVFRTVEAARRRRVATRAPVLRFTPELEARLAARIPFAWTADQAAAVQTLRVALAQPRPMGLLLQGDVGTGKTAVALFAALAAIASGLQVAFLAPTELLAEQHFAKVEQWLAGSRVRVGLLTGSATKRDRAAAELASGAVQLVFGTHALLSASTQFARLGLVVIDEQHRFGVEQRQTLVRKGVHPHLLVLSATPIPRTLTLALFGDLDVAVLRDRPAGVRPALARHLPGKAAWPRVRRLIERRVRRGQGTFVVCPRVGEDGEKGGAVATCQALAKVFACGLVHGRLPAVQRHAVVQQFRDGAFPVLVGTTVLEVGVDVPHATLMVIVGADRFGLATLHQLRGRVGRAGRRGLCVLLGEANERTQALCKTTDGFALAELDLALRGSGEILGLRQSGAGELRALDPVQDLELLLRARQAVADERGDEASGDFEGVALA